MFSIAARVAPEKLEPYQPAARFFLGIVEGMMEILEQEKLEALVISPWRSRFTIDNPITKKRISSERKEASNLFINELRELNSKGFNVYALSILLNALIDEETGYRRVKNNIIQYDRAIRALSPFLKLFGVQYCKDILQRHKNIWVQFTKRWQSKRTPKKTGAKFIRCQMIHLLIKGAILIKTKRGGKLIFNQISACNQISQLLLLVGLSRNNGLECETLEKDYRVWQKLKSPVKCYDHVKQGRGR